MTQKSSESPTALKAHGYFFQIDVRTWRHLCDHLDLNAAVAYLCLARGSGANNRDTGWSVNAIRCRTGLGPRLAGRAIDQLSAKGFILRDPSSPRTRPRYTLIPAHEISGCPGAPPIAMTEVEHWLYDQLLQADGVVSATQDFAEFERLIVQLAEKGWLQEGDGEPSSWKVVEYDWQKAAEPQWVWLPNSIVDGAGSETPPLERLRQSRNLSALRLFVELYHLQALAEDGGIPWHHFSQNFDRYLLGERGEYNIWGFRPVEAMHTGDGSIAESFMTGYVREDGWDAGWHDFLTSWKLLADQLHLVDIVPHLIDAKSEDAAIVHPVVMGDVGTPAERKLFVEARQAAAACLSGEQLVWAASRQILTMVPVERHRAEVQMVGIVRLRYRPRTKMTAAWIARSEDWNEWARRYTKIAAGAGARG